MDEKDLKKIEEYIKEAHLAGLQSGKKETSDLVGDLKSVNIRVMEGITSINKRLDTITNSVDKQQDKLAQHDIINAQITITQQSIVDALKELKTTDLSTLKKNDEENTKWRNKAEGSLSTFKWLFGALGIGNVAMLIKLFTR